jgi:hypothetical protein
MRVLPDGVGWLATAVFAVSYFCKGKQLRIVQGLAALLWMSYGLMIRAVPVVVANLIVSSLALYSAWRADEPPHANPTRE